MAVTGNDGGGWHPHYKAVAMPFTVLYAAWPLALAAVVLVFMIGLALVAMGLTSIAMIAALPLTITGHISAIMLTNRYKFALGQLLAAGNHRVASNNLGARGLQTFAND